MNTGFTVKSLMTNGGRSRVLFALALLVLVSVVSLIVFSICRYRRLGDVTGLSVECISYVTVIWRSERTHRYHRETSSYAFAREMDTSWNNNEFFLSEEVGYVLIETLLDLRIRIRPFVSLHPNPTNFGAMPYGFFVFGLYEVSEDMINDVSIAVYIGNSRDLEVRWTYDSHVDDGFLSRGYSVHPNDENIWNMLKLLLDVY